MVEAQRPLEVLRYLKSGSIVLTVAPSHPIVAALIAEKLEATRFALAVLQGRAWQSLSPRRRSPAFLLVLERTTPLSPSRWPLHPLPACLRSPELWVDGRAECWGGGSFVQWLLLMMWRAWQGSV